MAFRPDVIAGRAETAGTGHRVASAARTAPESAAATFRNLDRQIGAGSDRHQHHGRAGPVAKLIVNAAPRTNVRIIDCFLVLEVELAPLRRFERPARGKLASVAAKTTTMRLREPIILLNAEGGVRPGGRRPNHGDAIGRYRPGRIIVQRASPRTPGSSVNEATPPDVWVSVLSDETIWRDPAAARMHAGGARAAKMDNPSSQLPMQAPARDVASPPCPRYRPRELAGQVRARSDKIMLKPRI
jgi:hypothetical protein